MSKRDFVVRLVRVTEHEFRVPSCNSPEEATSIAEEMIESGDSGSVTVVDTQESEVYEAEGE